jgi:hypothetical protein
MYAVRPVAANELKWLVREHGLYFSYRTPYLGFFGMTLVPEIHVDEILALLAEFFGIQFQVRAAGKSAEAAAAAPTATGNRSGVRELPDGAAEVSIYLGSVMGGDLVVTGRSRGPAADLLKCLPSMAVKYLSVHRKIRQQESTLDDYAAYLSKHLEELTWLRTLAEHLDLCQVGQRLREVAGRVLPALRDMLRTQELLMVCPVDDGNRISAGGFEITLRSGQSPLSDRDCLCVFEKLRQQARDGTFVTNHLATDADEGGSAANPCLLVAIGEPQQGFGWLLAIGRDRSPSAIDLAAGQIRAGSEYEFGTVEATLLNTAATMLATHARNLAMLEAKETSGVMP